MSNLPTCGAKGCDELADPRYSIHTHDVRVTVLVCDAHGNPGCKPPTCTCPEAKPMGGVPPHLAKAAKRLRAKARKALEGMSDERKEQLAGSSLGMRDELPDDYADTSRLLQEDAPVVAKPHMLSDAFMSVFGPDPRGRARAQARLAMHFGKKALEDREDDS